MAQISETNKSGNKSKKVLAVVIPVVCVCIALIVVLFTVILPSGKYNNAVRLMNDGKYNEAITAFEDLDGYKDSKEQIEACKTGITEANYRAAYILLLECKYDEAIAAFAALGDYKDSKKQIEACESAITEDKYNAAIELLNAGNIVEAYDSLIALNGYKDSKEKADSIFEQYKPAKLKQADVGDTVYFGSYEQDNDIKNGKEDIEWYVIAKEGNAILLISKYALDCKSYDSVSKDSTWENCVLRNWLNGVFYNFSFSADEKNIIQTTAIAPIETSVDGSDSAVVSNDNIFILSVDEFNKYIINTELRICVPTAYAVSQEIFTIGNAADGNISCRWWLRSPDHDKGYAACVDNSGNIYYSGYGSFDISAGVRPSTWINIGD